MANNSLVTLTHWVPERERNPGQTVCPLNRPPTTNAEDPSALREVGGVWVVGERLPFGLQPLHDLLDGGLVVPGGSHQEAPRELRGLRGPRRLVDRGALLGGQAEREHPAEVLPEQVGGLFDLDSPPSEPCLQHVAFRPKDALSTAPRGGSSRAFWPASGHQMGISWAVFGPIFCLRGLCRGRVVPLTF